MTNWYNRHNFDDNMDYTLKVLDKFNIKKYHFVTDAYGHSALIIDIGLNNYRIEIDDYVCEMVILKRNITRRGSRHPKTYMDEVKRFKKDCCYDGIKWCSKDSERL